MSGKQLTRLLVALVVAVALWGGFAFTRHARSDRDAGLALARIDTSAVDTMAFVRPPDTIVVVREADGGWQVNGFPAATSMVNQALAALVDTTNWSELAAESRASQVAMGVSADSGRRVRIAVKGGAGVSLITGHQTSDYTGVFVRRPADSAVYALHGPLSRALGHALADWRDKTVVAIAPDSVSRIEVEHRGQRYALVRAGAVWRFAGGAAADSTAVSQLLRRFHPLTATGFAGPADADSLHFDRPVARVRLFGGAATPAVTMAFDSTNAHVWVRTGGTGTVYALDTWTLDELVPAQKSLRAGAPKAR
jgi:hypothetical protein